MSWTDVRILYMKELRSAFRERSIVVNSVLLPIFMYPLLLWLLFSGMTFVQGLTEGFTSRVVVLGDPGAHRPLLDTLRSSEDLEILDLRDGDRSGALASLLEGDADAVLELLATEGEAAALPGNVRARVLFDRSSQRSQQARSRVEAVVGDYREDWLEREAAGRGLDEAGVPFALSSRNVATERQMGALLISQLVPLFLLIMVALGCLVPAVDTTAGERERSTWETTVTVAAPRLAVVTAKYLYVATLGILAGLLNVVAIMVSIGAVIEPLLAEQGARFQFSIPWLAVPVLAVGTVALALFFAAAMMLLASFARTFKDGQAMVTPVYYLVFVPLLLGSQTEQHLTPLKAALPVVNVFVMMKDAIQGVFLWPLIAATVAMCMLTVVLCLLLARQILKFEDFLLGAHEGSFFRFVRDRLLPGRASSPRAP